MLYFLSVVLVVLASEALGVELDPHLAQIKCYPQALRVLDSWAPHREWRRVSLQSQIHRSPTQKIGHWVESRVNSAGRILLLRLSPDTITRVSFGDGCAPQLDVESRGKTPPAHALSDQKLEDWIRGSQTGILYAWSPHMPLSTEGWKNILTAASKFGIPVFPMTDPHASRQDIERATRVQALQLAPPIESFELFYRGLGTHYPAVIVFKEGRIVGPVFPGVKETKVYVEFIKDHLSH